MFFIKRINIIDSFEMIIIINRFNNIFFNTIIIIIKIIFLNKIIINRTIISQMKIFKFIQQTRF